MKYAKHKRTNILYLYVYDISAISKVTETEGRLQVTRGWKEARTES